MEKFRKIGWGHPLSDVCTYRHTDTFYIVIRSFTRRDRRDGTAATSDEWCAWKDSQNNVEGGMKGWIPEEHVISMLVACVAYDLTFEPHRGSKTRPGTDGVDEEPRVKRWTGPILRRFILMLGRVTAFRVDGIAKPLTLPCLPPLFARPFPFPILQSTWKPYVHLARTVANRYGA